MKVVEKAMFNVVGKLIVCEEHKLSIEMPKVFKQMEERKLEIDHRLNDFTIDITIERDGSKYKQMVGYEVSSIDSIPKELSVLTIPKYKYLYYQHNGSSSGIYDAFVMMYDYALEEKIELDELEFKIEIYNDIDQEYDLYLKLK